MRFFQHLVFLSLITPFAQSQALFAAESGLDVNDVAILFPLDGAKKPLPLIPLNAESFLTDTLFGEVLGRATQLGIGAPQTAPIAKLSDWNITAFRYDPCAPTGHGLAESAGLCTRELRIIAQPQGRFAPGDSALHLIYALGAGVPLANDPVLIDLIALKKQTENLSGTSNAGQPLGVHPALAAAMKAKREDVPPLFRAFLKKHALSDKLHIITMVGLNASRPTDWIFFGGDVVEGHWQQTLIPNLESNADKTIELSINDGSDAFKGIAIDKSLSTGEFFNIPPAPESDLGALNKTIHTLENPALSTRNTADCVSCHSSTSISLSSDFAFARHVDGITAEAPKGITAFPAPLALPAHPLHWNLRAFGYFGLIPTVSLRTVHEAAESTKIVNAILKRVAPGPDCSLVSREVMNCFVDTSRQDATPKTAKECLSICLAPTPSRLDSRVNARSSSTP